MREGLRMAVTLLIIGGVCGGLLSAVNSYTEPIIEERQQREFLEALEGFFPEVEEAEEKEINDQKYFIAYDAAGNEIGVVAQARASGYGDEPIRYDLAVDMEGEIVGIRVVSHTETPGIGDFIAEEEWQEQQIVGLTFDDEIAVDVDVDAISGATVTLRGIVSSIREEVDTIGMEFLGLEVEVVEIDPSAVDDGTYTGVGTGFADDIEVEVTVSGGEITDIEIISHDDTPDYFDQAAAEMPGRIIEAQSHDVEMVSGATASAEGIVEAVADALN